MDWIILRTSPGQTLALAASLADAGFEVWAPERVWMQRRPRSQREVEVTRAMTPGYVFAAGDRLGELLALARAPSLIYRVWDSELKRMVAKGHPHFSIYQCGGAVPRVSAASLAPLHATEDRLRKNAIAQREKTRRKGAPPQFAIGQAVRLPGAFEGLDLIVQEVDRSTVRLLHPHWLIPVTLSAWDLEAALPVAA